MLTSNRSLLLSLTLLIAVSGCSGSRMRQMFAPDREFMALSELKEYQEKRGGSDRESEHSGSAFASLPGISSDEDDSSGFRLSKLLPSIAKGRIPEDPFLDESDPVDVVGASTYNSLDENSTAPQTESTADVIAVSETDDASWDEYSFTFDESETADTDSAMVIEPESPQASSEDVSDSLTFAEIMAEFESDDMLDEPSAQDEDSLIIEKMERDWLVRNDPAAEANSTDDSSGAEVDFAALIAEANADLASESDGFGASLTTEAPEVSEDADTLSASAAEPDTAELIVEATSATQQLQLPPQDEDTTDVSVPATETVAQTTTELSQALPQLVLPQPAAESSDAADLEAESVPPVAVAMDAPQRPKTPQPEQRPHNPFDTPQAVASSLAAKQPMAAAPISPARPADTTFLRDFQSLTAAAQTPTPVAAGSTSLLRRQSPRSWLLLLGAVVIVYLLLAPERKNRYIPKNR